MDGFKATHRIVHDGKVIPVMLADGNLYQQDEWNTCSAADYTIDSGKVLFQGAAFNGKIKKMRVKYKMPSWQDGTFRRIEVAKSVARGEMSVEEANEELE